MGFFRDLSDGLPHKGVARGRALQDAALFSANIIDGPRGLLCDCCRREFGRFGSKNLIAIELRLQKPIQFPIDNGNLQRDPQGRRDRFIVCHECVEVFAIGANDPEAFRTLFS